MAEQRVSPKHPQTLKRAGVTREKSSQAHQKSLSCWSASIVLTFKTEFARKHLQSSGDRENNIEGGPSLYPTLASKVRPDAMNHGEAAALSHLTIRTKHIPFPQKQEAFSLDIY